MTHMSEQFLTFALDEEVFGIEIESVKEILELPGITSLSLTSEAMLGGINLREHAIVVFDLWTIFQQPSMDDSVERKGFNQKDFILKSLPASPPSWSFKMISSSVGHSSFALSMVGRSSLRQLKMY